MNRQSGYRVKLTLFVPYADGDLDSQSAAITAAKALCTRKGIVQLAEMSEIDIEESSAKDTSRVISAEPVAMARTATG